MAVRKESAGKVAGILIILSLVALVFATIARDTPTPTKTESEAIVSASPTPVGQDLSRVSATGEGTETDLAAPIAEPPTTAPADPGPELETSNARQSTAQPSSKVMTIAVDPGHGGPEAGAAKTLNDGTVIAEKAVNLKIALKLRDLLEQNGYRVVLSKEADARASSDAEELPAGYSRTRADLQARVDIANNAQADLFIAIHNNGSGDPGQSGTEVWYSKDRPFAARNLALAQLVKDALITEIRRTGYYVHDRGIKDDTNFRTWQGRSYNLFVLGPPRTEPYKTRATQMPGILGETLFVSNPTEATLLARDDILDAIARGYYYGIVSYFEKFPHN